MNHKPKSYSYILQYSITSIPIPKGIAVFNKYATNRLFLLFAGGIPPFAIVNHQGRYSGNSYRTPIMAFPTKDGFVFALTYGRSVDWVKNLISSNKGALEYQGEVIEIHNIRHTSYNDVRKEFPFVIRFLLHIIKVEHCLIVDKNTTKGIIMDD